MIGAFLLPQLTLHRLGRPISRLAIFFDGDTFYQWFTIIIPGQLGPCKAIFTVIWKGSKKTAIIWTISFLKTKIGFVLIYFIEIKTNKNDIVFFTFTLEVEKFPLDTLYINYHADTS